MVASEASEKLSSCSAESVVLKLSSERKINCFMMRLHRFLSDIEILIFLINNATENVGSRVLLLYLVINSVILTERLS